jgi:hypothetical protein
MSYTSNEFTVDEIGFIQIALTKVLAAVARGELDLNLLAREELAARGLDKQGEWVGFEATKKVHEIAINDATAEQQLMQIARQHLQTSTLETRHSDQLDFHEVSVWGIKSALQAAFEAGRQSACAKQNQP